jgi:hypothetical protein
MEPSWKFLGGGIYSYTEAVDGRGVDGKTVYRKTVDFGALPNATSKSVTHGLTGVRFVHLRGIAINSTTGQYFPIPFVPGSTAGIITLVADATYVTISTGTMDRSAFYAYVTLWYTKN